MPSYRRNNVQVRGTGSRAIVFVHGFGCDHSTWHRLLPSFQREFVTVTLDLVGSGASQLPAYDSSKYATLSGYADDLVEIGQDLELQNAVLVGHSCGAIIGALACRRRPELFSELIMIAPSARYLNDGDYKGGFTAAQVEDLLSQVTADHRRWASLMVPLMMSHPDQPGLSEMVIQGFDRLDAAVARDMARAIFCSDWREEASHVGAQTLILQSRGDWVAPPSAGEDLRRRVHNSTLKIIDDDSHFPHLTSCRDTISAMGAFLMKSPMPISQPDSGGRSRPWSSRRTDIVRLGMQILGTGQGGKLDLGSAAEDGDLLSSLLSRSGELWMHLGRYDMYARTLHEMLTQEFGGEVAGFNLRSRGDELVRLLGQLDGDAANQFAAICTELHAVLRSHDITAHRGARIPGLFVLNDSTPLSAPPRQADWFDQSRAGAADYSARLEQVERDILRIVALCFKVSNCALKIRAQLGATTIREAAGVQLFSLIYVSTATSALEPARLESLLRSSRRHNQAARLSGLLLYKDAQFMQALEGSEQAVRALFERIARDPRHHGVRVLFQGPVGERGFAFWTMGFRNLHNFPAAAGPANLTPSFTGPAFVAHADRAQKLLRSFYTPSEPM